MYSTYNVTTTAQQQGLKLKDQGDKGRGLEMLQMRLDSQVCFFFLDYTNTFMGQKRWDNTLRHSLSVLLIVKTCSGGWMEQFWSVRG